MIWKNSKLYRNGGYVYGKKELVLLLALVIYPTATSITGSSKIPGSIAKNLVAVPYTMLTKVI